MSYSAFLFSLSNKQGTDPVLFPLKTDKRYTAHPVRPGQGPTFGNGDLVLETMSNGYSELDNSFGTTADAGFLFAEANVFVISDLEVLYQGGNCDNNKIQLKSSSRYQLLIFDINSIDQFFKLIHSVVGTWGSMLTADKENFTLWLS